MDPVLKQKLTATSKWLRALYIILFAIINYFVQMVSWAVALFQFILVLITDKPNQRLLQFSQNLGKYMANIIHYISYNTEEKPFPFSDWPK